jgi:hypothetical protein
MTLTNQSVANTSMAKASAQRELVEILANSRADPRDVLDMARALVEIISRSGWGKVEITLQSGEVDEIVISHRRKPKVERRPYIEV